MDKRDGPSSNVRAWLTAVRPFACTASVLTVVLGAAMAYHAGYSLRWGALALTLLGVVRFHTAANLLNDCFDHRRGLDRQVFPSRGTLVRGWITERQAFRTVMVCLAAGVLPVFGSWWVQTRTSAWLPVLWSIPLVSRTVGILHANNWRDIETDDVMDCQTLATRLGSAGSRRYYRMLVLGPFVLVALHVGLGPIPSLRLPTPPHALLAFLALPLTPRLARTQPRKDVRTFVMLDAETAQLHTLFGISCAAVFWISRHL